MGLSDAVQVFVQDYGHLDSENLDTPSFLIACSSAHAYLAYAGIWEPEEGTDAWAQYALCLAMMAVDAYDNRQSTLVGSNVQANPIFRQHFNQLKNQGLATMLAAVDQEGPCSIQEN